MYLCALFIRAQITWMKNTINTRTAIFYVNWAIAFFTLQPIVCCMQQAEGNLVIRSVQIVSKFSCLIVGVKYTHSETQLPGL